MPWLILRPWILTLFLADCLCPQVRPLEEEIEKAKSLFDEALHHGRLVVPGGALEVLLQLQSKMVLDDWGELRETLLTELVRGGDRVVARYVAGDEVPQQKSDYERCAAYFEAAVKLDPSPRSEGRMWFCRGRSLLEPDEQKRFDLAINDLKKAILLEPDAAYHYNALGVAYLEESLYDKAAEQFREAIQREPRWSYPRHHLALTYMETGDYLSAQETYRQAIALAGTNKQEFGYLHYNLGLLAHELGHKKEARREYEKALELFHSQAKQNEERAANSTSTGDDQDAAAARYRARILMRDEAEAYNALGVLWASQGDRKRAEEAYNQALTLNPGQTGARRNLDLLRSRGKNAHDVKKSTSFVGESQLLFRQET